MRLLAAALCVIVSPTILTAAQPASPDQAAAHRAPVDGAIDRGLRFLVKDAIAWRNEHHCVSCHHAGLVIWSMREAKECGIPVDEPVLTELTKWVAESGDGRTSLPRPAGVPKAINTKALHFALALAADPQPDTVSQNGMKLFLATLESDQTANGSWSGWPNTRPPIFDPSDETTTALATLALLPAAASGNTTAKTARDRGLQWLAESKPSDEPQSTALRLVLASRLHRPVAESRPLVERIVNRQNADGGWSQAKELSSDAWATGQALYALSHAGLKVSDAAIARGQLFLVKTQRADGSWPMISRPGRPGGEGAKSLIPITGAGTAWAVIGLSRSL